jgi:Transglycosylase SLT domain/SPOR domain
MRMVFLVVLLILAALPVQAMEATRVLPVPETATADPAREGSLVLAALPPRRPAPLPQPEPAAAGVCRMIEQAAEAALLDSGFFARLIWQESRFDPDAVSPAGAQGIAQFVPGTAALRQLDDPFDAEKALRASALYLADLIRSFGNLGLAAAAYNGGEARLARYLADGGRLPGETRAYVATITGLTVEDWRDAPPSSHDLALKGANFHEGCLALASGRGGTTPAAAPPPPWGVVIASGRDRATTERQVARIRSRHAGLLRMEPVHYGRNGRLARARDLMVAQVGRDSRTEAEALCARLHAAGGDCIVLRN